MRMPFCMANVAKHFQIIRYIVAFDAVNVMYVQILLIIAEVAVALVVGVLALPVEFFPFALADNLSASSPYKRPARPDGLSAAN